MNLLTLMPWLSQVVDNGYDPKIALSLQWESLCESIEPIATDTLEYGFEKGITSYARGEVRKMETVQLCADEFPYGEVIHEIAYV